jgi:hypothetical protein
MEVCPENVGDSPLQAVEEELLTYSNSSEQEAPQEETLALYSDVSQTVIVVIVSE